MGSCNWNVRNRNFRNRNLSMVEARSVDSDKGPYTLALKYIS